MLRGKCIAAVSESNEKVSSRGEKFDVQRSGTTYGMQLLQSADVGCETVFRQKILEQHEETLFSPRKVDGKKRTYHSYAQRSKRRCQTIRTSRWGSFSAVSTASLPPRECPTMMTPLPLGISHCSRQQAHILLGRHAWAGTQAAGAVLLRRATLYQPQMGDSVFGARQSKPEEQGPRRF